MHSLRSRAQPGNFFSVSPFEERKAIALNPESLYTRAIALVDAYILNQLLIDLGECLIL